MKRVTYRKLRIQNFLSIGNEAVEIDFKKGLNIITGRNLDNESERSNGSGKSSLIEGFFYALFGQTIRSIKQEFIVNNSTKSKGLVELEFDVQDEGGAQSYSIKRQVKPSKVELWKGSENITNDSISNTNTAICQLVGSNPVLCKSCDILSLSDNVPFMAMVAKDKRRFIEDIFSLEVFSKMTGDLKDLIKENKTEIGVSSARVDEINYSIDALEKQKEAFAKKEEERLRQLTERRKTIESEISKVEKELAECVIPDTSSLEAKAKKIADGIKLVDSKIDACNKARYQAEATHKSKLAEIRRNSSVGGASCDKCLQKIPHTHVEELRAINKGLEDEAKLIEASIQSSINDVSGLNAKKKALQKAASELQETVSEAKTAQVRKSSLERLLKQSRESLDSLNDDSSPQEAPLFDPAIESAILRKDTEVQNLTRLRRESDDYDVCKFILGEEGVKSFVVKRLLGMLNTSIQRYITSLGMNLRCKFDEYFDEQMSNDKGVAVSYWNLSGGERRTIDMACSWAFKEIRNKITGISSNLEFCDEIFDSALDERGFDLLVEVTKSRVDNQKLDIYAVSHRKEIQKHIDGEIIFVEKENGVTRRVAQPS